MKHKVIELTEQKGYNTWEQYPEALDGYSKERNEIKVNHSKGSCTCLNFKVENGRLSYQTSYFIGLDWIVENKLAAWVKPKMNDNTHQIDYMSMLMCALTNIDNHKHLSDLIHIQFNKPYIEIEQKDDELSLFIIIQLLPLLRKLVQGGLRKSYYMVNENLNSKIKGKILVERDIKNNRTKGKHYNAYCQHQYYGIDSEENRILKKAFMIACQIVGQSHMRDNTSLRNMINYIRPAFYNVSDAIELNSIKHYKYNPLYPEYRECLRISQLLLRRHFFSINPTKNKNNQQLVATPPYWIDMSKLFELYVYQQLRKHLPTADIKYHERMNYQELDILFDDKKDTKYVIDAKYKPRYEDSNISMYDIRQVCGYARMRGVYNILGINENKIIPSLIIYPAINGVNINKNEFYKIIKTGRDDRYIEVYKFGIKIPIIELYS